MQPVANLDNEEKVWILSWFSKTLRTEIDPRNKKNFVRCTNPASKKDSKTKFMVYLAMKSKVPSNNSRVKEEGPSPNLKNQKRGFDSKTSTCRLSYKNNYRKSYSFELKPWSPWTKSKSRGQSVNIKIMWDTNNPKELHDYYCSCFYSKEERNIFAISMMSFKTLANSIPLIEPSCVTID